MNDNATVEHQKYSCDEIDCGIYLGNRAVAEEEAILKSLCVTRILTIDSVPLDKKLENIQYFYVRALDDPEDNLLSSFEECYSFIEDEIESGACLVHCYEGMSRGATIVAAYMMKKYSLSHEDAIQRLKMRRQGVQPNPGFMRQLKLYENMGWTVTRESKIYSSFLLSQLAVKVLKNADNIRELLEEYWADVNKSNVTGDKVYKCKKCRKLLFTALDQLPHSLRPNNANLNEETKDSTKHRKCSGGYFIEPVPWMLPLLLKHQEKLLCPHCKAKIGCFSWSGVSCDCGVKVGPGFRVNSSRVDECS